MSGKAKYIEEYLRSYAFAEGDNLSLFPAGKQTVLQYKEISGCATPFYINEFWTAKQRQASSIHEISYRACFKAQLPRFFIDLLTEPGDLVYDPFSGRGTTAVEAALAGRRVVANDINPLSAILAKPRLAVPDLASVRQKLDQLPFEQGQRADIDLSMFYHPETEAEIVALKNYLAAKSAANEEDDVDRWLRMIATNRLSGHSSGFFSVYTLPPNQAVSPQSQVKINARRNQHPSYRDTREIIFKKTKSLLKDLGAPELENLITAGRSALFLQNDAAATPALSDNTVKLTVTSPPFLAIVQYSKDNWLRCWFNEIDSAAVEKQMIMARTVAEWSSAMGKVFGELYRITAPGGWVAFEVGEVLKGQARLEEYVIPVGLKAGFSCFGVVINSQSFTKTSNIWGIDNNYRGTNSNRIVLFTKNNYAAY